MSLSSEGFLELKGSNINSFYNSYWTVQFKTDVEWENVCVSYLSPNCAILRQL